MILKILILLSCLFSISFAKIYSTYSINSSTIKEIVKNINSKTLVLIAMDNTVVMPKSKIFRYHSPYKGVISELEGMRKYNYNFIEQIIKTLIIKRELILTEKEWPDFIKNLNQNGITTIGFFIVKESLILSDNFQNLMLNKVNSLGIHLTKTLGAFDNDPLFDKDNLSSFTDGIIFSDSIDKLLKNKYFLSILNSKKFENVIFISSNLDEISYVSKFFSIIDVNYYGIEYLSIKQNFDTPSDKLARFQLKILLNSGEWLEDDIAGNSLAKKNN